MKLCPKCQKHFSDDANFCPVDAARLSPIEGSPTGSAPLSSRFELGEKLGGIRTGAVHRAVDKQGGNNGSWNSAHPSRGCSQKGLISTGGAGKFYCFAVN